MIGLVYLLWAPLGPEPLRAFLRSYERHRAGADHELVIVLNDALGRGQGEGVEPHERHGGLLDELAGTPHRLIALDAPAQDLAAYAHAAGLLEHATLCLLNSYSVVLADGWLGHLTQALQEPRVVLAGASGSWESQAEWIRGKAMFWPYQLARVRQARRDFPRFPNPHMRTTALAVDRRALLGLGLDGARDKRAAYLLESGQASITRQVLAQGGRAVVVGRDARAYDVDEWPASATYRSGDQRNLLVADNRTDDWQRAGRRLRRRLSRDAWGDSVAESVTAREPA